jgi:O-antigen biosynthesis protein WbqV
VPIRFIGLRPGEKLYEELFDTSESKIESSIPGIFEAMPSPIPLELLVEGFHQLERLITKGDAIELSRLTHEMVVASASSRWAEILRRLSVESGDKTMINPPTPTLLSRASQSPAIPLSRAVG